MSYRSILLIGISLLLISCNKDSDMVPKAEKIPFEYEIHGKKIIDEYHWLRDPNWPKVSNKKILTYLEEENKYTDQYFAKISQLEDRLFSELKSRIQLTDSSVHTKKKEYFYYSRTEAEKNYPIYCRKKDSLSGKEEIILDVNELAEDKSFTRISALSISPSQRYLGYSIDFEGSEKYTIKVKDLSTGKNVVDEIPSTIGQIQWHEDESGFFYSPVNENWRHDKIFFHKLGTPYADDRLIIHETDILNQVSISKSSSKEYFFVESSGHDSNEIYYFSMKDPEFKPIKLISRKEKIFYNIDHSGQFFYIHTNDQGPNFRLARMDISSLASPLPEENFAEYLPHDPGAYLDGFSLTKSFVIVNYKKNALPEVEIYRISDKHRNIVTFPDEVYVANGYSTNFEEDDIRVNYSSLKRPDIIYNYDFEHRQFTVLKQQMIPSGFNPDEYSVRRIWADNAGVKVPVTLFYKKSLFKEDGTNPLYLYGYGSYGYSVPPSFRNTAVSFANRGFVYAIAHIRGGDDLGFNWYESAKFLNKKNTFEDFIQVALTLIDLRYTSKGNITIAGGSAGGLLIGYSINNEPELYKVAIAHVPFVDVVNTMLDESLPLTPGEFKEWGNPKEEEFFNYMLSYSPYDNVGNKNYPNLFVTAGLSDPRVTYWEAAKWVAKLRDKNLSHNNILLKMNMSAGHAGASGRFDYLREVAEELGFIFSSYDIKK